MNFSINYCAAFLSVLFSGFKSRGLPGGCNGEQLQVLLAIFLSVIWMTT
jgi:hypothetical protein